jgi:3-oxoadipyl-CoA thiolase
MEAYIVDYQRTPFGKLGGILSHIRPDDLAAATIRALVQRNENVDFSRLDDVILGCANQAGEDNRNIARFAGLLAGLPVEVPGITVNRLCASGMQSVLDAAARIQSGMDELILAGGVESMSRAPYVMAKPDKAFDRNPQLVDTTLGWRFVNPAFTELYHPYSMGETAENVAERWSISRDRQDAFAWQSHMKYLDAHYDGVFSEEIIPLVSSDEFAPPDQGVRPDTTKEKLAKLPTVFRENGTVTAGNASGLNDGAAAMLIASGKQVEEQHLRPLARIVSAAVAGVHPDIMGTGPVPAIRKLLQKTGLTIADIDLFELNEAYASQVLYCIDELQLDPATVNVNGGALAIGHPLGASGTRIVGHLALELRRRNKRYGIAAMCVGVGQGVALLIENGKCKRHFLSCENISIKQMSSIGIKECQELSIAPLFHFPF